MFEDPARRRSQEVVKLSGGTVVGRRVDGVSQFLGIPYAAAKRFQVPRPIEPWSGAVQAREYGAACPQPPIRENLVIDPEVERAMFGLADEPQSEELPLAQRVVARGRGWGEAARACLVPRRRLQKRFGLGALGAMVRRIATGPAGRCRGRHREPPDRSAGPPASRTARGIGQPGTARSAGWAWMAARQCIRLRRRSGPRDDLRRVGRRRQSDGPDGDAVGARTVPEGDLPERSPQLAYAAARRSASPKQSWTSSAPTRWRRSRK